MIFVALQAEHGAALADFVAEFAAAGEERIPAFLPSLDWSFEEMVKGFAKQSHGEGLPEGWVPCTTRFLVHEARILGLFNLRHLLNENLLRFGGHIGYSVRPSEQRKGYGTLVLKEALRIARGLKIESALLTTDPDNTASAGVITKCEGVFEDRTYYEPVGHEVSRYWINLS